MMVDEPKESLRQMPITDMVSGDVTVRQPHTPAMIDAGARRRSQWPIALGIVTILMLVGAGI